MKFIKDYDCTIYFHHGKVNVVPDALRRKVLSTLACLTVGKASLWGKIKKMNVDLCLNELSVIFAHLGVQPTILDKVKSAQGVDPQLVKIMDEVRSGARTNFLLHDVALRFGNCLCVPNDPDLKLEILEEAQCSTYSVHPSNTKMYQNLKDYYWWNNMKRG